MWKLSKIVCSQPRLLSAFWAVVCLAAVLPAGAQAETGSQGTETRKDAKSGAPAPTQATDEPEGSGRPVLLYIPPQRTHENAKRDDIDLKLDSHLRETLRSAQQFQIIPFSPGQPIIRRALLEHVVGAIELIDPVKPETWERLARAVGARYVLSVTTKPDASVLEADVRYERSVGLNWLLTFSDHITIPMSVGKHHFKPDEAAALAVDAIATRLQIPSHLADSLHVKPIKLPKSMTTPLDTPSPAKITAAASGSGLSSETPKRKAAPSVQKPKPKDTATREVSPRETASSDLSADTTGATPSMSNGNDPIPSPMVTKPLVTKPSKPSKTQGSKTRAATEKPPGRNPKVMMPDHNDAFRTDTDPGRLTPPPRTAPALPDIKPDYEAQATHFEQVGDLANAIRSWRFAINEQPDTIRLRSALIQDYLGRHLTQEALDETERALNLDPQDATLHRFRGNILLDLGRAADARKDYELAAHLAPNDIAIRVAIGDAAMREGQIKTALDTYEEAVKSDPKNPLPHRRLARAYAQGATADLSQYAASLKEAQQIRSLLPSTDTRTYFEDYSAIMKTLDQRLRDLLEEIQGNYQALVQNQRKKSDVQKVVRDILAQAEAAADFLDNLPAGAGQGQSHANYVQGAAKLQEAASDFTEYLKSGDTQQAEEMKHARVDAYGFLNEASKRLFATPVQPSAP